MSKVNDAIQAAKSLGLHTSGKTEAEWIGHFLTSAKSRRITLSAVVVHNPAAIKMSTQMQGIDPGKEMDKSAPPNEDHADGAVKRLISLMHFKAPELLDKELKTVKELPDDMIRRVAARVGVCGLSGDKSELVQGLRDRVELFWSKQEVCPFYARKMMSLWDGSGSLDKVFIAKP